MADEDLSTLSEEQLINRLTDEERKQYLGLKTPPPGPIEGTVRAFAQGATGYPQEQPKDIAFGNQNPAASGGGGMLGRMADYILPALIGMKAGRVLGRGSFRPIDEAARESYGRIAARNEGRARGIRDADELKDYADLGGGAAKRDAIRRNTWGRNMGYAGGVVGSAAGGYGGALLHGEDPQSGALYGGAVGSVPLAGAAVKAVVPPVLGNLGWAAGAGLAGSAAQHLGAPPEVAKALDHFEFSNILKAVEKGFKR